MVQGRSTDRAPVTVVISTLNRPDQLARCLGALAMGTRQPVDVVVVDQGHEVADEVVARARRLGLSVRHLTQQRRGLSVSQNTGVSAARTDVVAIVDDDCVPDNRWVEVTEAAFSSASRPLLLTGRVLALPSEGDRVVALAVRDSTRRQEWTKPPMPWHIGTGGNFAVTRECFLAVGGNDERLGTGTAGRGANDLDLFYRLVRAGVIARFEPNLLVLHERATFAEHKSRQGTYGYGVGAMLGLWLRRGDRHALVVLAAWLRLRTRVVRSGRLPKGLLDEVRVVMGTAIGLVYGLRNGDTGDVP